MHNGLCIADEIERLRPLGTEEIRGQLIATYQVSIETTKRQAALVFVLNERGDDITAIPCWDQLLEIATGRLLPEAFVKITNTWLFRKAKSLINLEEQRIIADDKRIPVVTTINGEDFDHRLLAPSEMTKEQRRQVFADKYIRSPEKQVLFRRSATAAPLKTSKSTMAMEIDVPFFNWVEKGAKKAKVDPAEWLRSMCEQVGLPPLKTRRK